MVWYRRTAEVIGGGAWVLPVVDDFGVAIGLVVGFLFDVVLLLRKGRGVVGGGDHIPCS